MPAAWHGRLSRLSAEGLPQQHQPCRQRPPRLRPCCVSLQCFSSLLRMPAWCVKQIAQAETCCGMERPAAAAAAVQRTRLPREPTRVRWPSRSQAARGPARLGQPPPMCGATLHVHVLATHQLGRVVLAGRDGRAHAGGAGPAALRGDARHLQPGLADGRAGVAVDRQVVPRAVARGDARDALGVIVLVLIDDDLAGQRAAAQTRVSKRALQAAAAAARAASCCAPARAASPCLRTRPSTRP